MTFKAIGDRFGITKQGAHKLILSSEHEPFRPKRAAVEARRRRVKGLAEEGLTCAEIGAALGVSREVVKKDLQWMRAMRDGAVKAARGCCPTCHRPTRRAASGQKLR